MSVLSQISELNEALKIYEQQIEETEQVYKNYFTKINTVNSTKNNATNKNIKKIKENLKGYKTKKSTTMKVLGVFSRGQANKNKNTRYTDAKTRYKSTLLQNKNYKIQELNYKITQIKNQLWLLENGIEYMVVTGKVKQETVDTFKNMGWTYKEPVLETKFSSSGYGHPQRPGRFILGYDKSIMLTDLESKLPELLQANSNRKTKEAANAVIKKEKDDAIKVLEGLGYTYIPAKEYVPPQCGMGQYQQGDCWGGQEAVEEHLIYETERLGGEAGRQPADLSGWEKQEIEISPATKKTIDVDCPQYTTYQGYEQGGGACHKEEREIPAQVKITYTRKLPTGYPERIRSSEIVQKAKELKPKIGGRRRTRRARRSAQ